MDVRVKSVSRVIEPSDAVRCHRLYRFSGAQLCSSQLMCTYRFLDLLTIRGRALFLSKTLRTATGRIGILGVSPRVQVYMNICIRPTSWSSIDSSACGLAMRVVKSGIGSLTEITVERNVRMVAEICLRSYRYTVHVWCVGTRALHICTSTNQTGQHKSEDLGY